MSADIPDVPDLDALAELLPTYDFEAFVAQGGMGAIYKARQRSLDRDVAIKVLPRGFGEDEEFRKSFEVEAKAMARLNHPNLIGVYDFGDVGGQPYIVMEFVNGKSLYHSAYNLAVDPVQAVEIVHGICNGLAHAHEHGVIHRDIKPANILLTPKAVPKIGDFGLARPTEGDQSGLVMGTPGYTAPEVMERPDQADRRSDLFALGVVLYELLIGRCPPYESTPPASSLCGCDPALDKICEKAMHPVAALRYANADEMAAALSAWLRHAASIPKRHVTAHRIAHEHGVHGHHGAHVNHAGSGHHASHPSKQAGGSGKKTLIAVAALVAIAIPCVVLLKKKDPPPASTAQGPLSTADMPATPATPVPEDSPKPTPPPVPEIQPVEPPAAPEPVVAAASIPAEPAIPAEPTIKPEATKPTVETPSKPDVPVVVSAAIIELDQKAVSLLTDLDAARGKELEANSTAGISSLQATLESLSPLERSRSTPLLAMIKSNIHNQRLPRFAENVAVADAFKNNLQQIRSKESTIDQTFHNKAVKIRDAYVARLKTAVTKSQDTAERDALTERARNAADVDKWATAIGVSLTYQKPESVLALTDPIVGRWKWFNGHSIAFRADGTGSGPGLECTWKLAGGSGRCYEVSWGEGKYVDQITLSTDCTTTTGKNQTGDAVGGTRVVE